MADQTKKITRDALEVFHKDIMSVWTNTDGIRKIFAPDLTNDEFRYFCGMGVALGANPFMREIFAVKYGNKPAAIIVSRDFRRKKASSQPDYMGCYIEAVYSFEKFVPNPAAGTVDHVIDVIKRYGGEPYPEPLGAYIVILRKDKHPFYHFVPTREYIQIIKDKDTGKLRRTKFWQNQLETMIKKVADAQGHHLAYLGLFSGTQSEEEVSMEQMNKEIESGEVIEDLTSKILQRGPTNGDPQKPVEPTEPDEAQTEEEEPVSGDVNAKPPVGKTAELPLGPKGGKR